MGSCSLPGTQRHNRKHGRFAYRFGVEVEDVPRVRLCVLLPRLWHRRKVGLLRDPHQILVPIGIDPQKYGKVLDLLRRERRIRRRGLGRRAGGRARRDRARRPRPPSPLTVA